MSKKQGKSAVFEHFTLTQDGKHFVCVCECETQCPEQGDHKYCDAKISAYSGANNKNTPTRASNLKRHLERHHPDILKAVKEKDSSHDSQPLPITSDLDKGKQLPQTSVTKFFVSDKVTVTMTKSTFKKNIIELVANDGLPLSLFSRPAFKCLNGEMARKLGVSLERESIRQMVIDEAIHQKEELRNSLKGKFVFLKMDACSRHRLNYFAINVRFVTDKNEIVTKTLAVKDTQAHHTGQFIQALVEKVMQDYELKKEQVICIVTDNASNMISTIKLMNAGREQEEAAENMSDLGMFINEDQEDAAVEESQETVVSREHEHEGNNDVLDDLIESASALTRIHHMRCVVHTQQLAIRDSLREGHAASLISKVRKVVTAARNPKIDSILKRRAGKGAIIDQATRWGSTYLMIQRLLELKSFLVDMANPQVTLTDVHWVQVTELEELLRLPFAVTKKLQAEDLTAGTFLKEWKNLVFRLSLKGGLIADGIVASMKRREALLTENEILLAAIYVDPMHRILLTGEQLTKGKHALLEVAVRMNGLAEQNSEECQGEGVNAIPAGFSSASSSDDELNFDKFLDHKERDAKRQRTDHNPSTPTSYAENKLITFKKIFSRALEEVEKFDRSSKFTVHEAIPHYPEVVRNVALVVTALPPTQVSVERLFSALRIISDLRASMKEDLTEAILFLRANSS